ncbi:MAG: low temperature requirement protein A [Rhodobacteraceae bacterium]|nr:low temperature requirement protein A [Paracoccaceae bacterium]
MTATIWHRVAPVHALRTLGPADTPRVTNMELFFDLVYVLTIIQLSHFLLDHASWLGAVEAATLFAAIWWAWNYTAWATNWINPDHTAGRLLMIALMACALLMAVAVPDAYGDRAALFVGAYVAMALIRAFYMAAVFRGEVMGRNYAQLGIWSALSGVLWVAGAALPEHRVWLWIMAVVVDYAAPYAGFWVPGSGRTPMETWPLRGLHLLERNQQVFIIALGESVLLLGTTLIGASLDAATLAAGGIGFLLIVALWWLYFVHTTEEGEHAFSQSSNHTELARAGLAYAHGIMVAGAIVVAVAIELILAHPLDSVHAPAVLTACAGPAIFLAGSAVFHRRMAQRVPPAYLAAIAALAVFGGLALILHLHGLLLGFGTLAILVALAWTGSRARG